jgi:hypothetical protein
MNKVVGVENPGEHDPAERAIGRVFGVLDEEGLYRLERQSVLRECLGWELVSQVGTGKRFDAALKDVTSECYAIRDEKVDSDRKNTASIPDIETLKSAILRRAALEPISIPRMLGPLAAELGVGGEVRANARCRFYRRVRRAVRLIAASGLLKLLSRGRFAITEAGRQVDGGLPVAAE